jgi:hypothetical protein
MEKPCSNEVASKIKKIYTTPKLETYGNLRTITEAVNNGHVLRDGPTPAAANKT